MKVLFLLFVLVSCGKDKKVHSPVEASQQVSGLFKDAIAANYFQKSTKVTLEVYYEPGAAPFEGALSWKILEDNLKAIFKYRATQPVLVIPVLLTEMRALGPQNKSSWSADDVLNLYRKEVSTASSGNEVRFPVFFLNGNADGNPNVIGFNISGTPIIAIFKSVVLASGDDELTQRYVEQSSLVHEMGHALGFVDNGVPMTTNYIDAPHGKHSSNSKCVMYWAHEGAADLKAFIRHLLLNKDAVMWGPEILTDAQNFSK